MATFLLIHGAWHGSWCWDRVASGLSQMGHTVLSPDLPGRSTPHSDITLKTYVDFLKKLLEEVAQPVIVVAHSFGGVIATQLASDLPKKIARLVYVCAFLPQNGQSLMDIVQSVNHPDQPSAMRVDSLGRTISLDISKLADLFFNCSPMGDQRWAIDRICPEPFYPMTEKVVLKEAHLAKIPKSYIECTKDRALTIEAQQAMHTKYACSVISLPTDHSPFLSMSAELTSLLTHE